MIRTVLVLLAGMGVGALGMARSHDDGEQVSLIDEQDIVELLDGREAKASFVEVAIGPGQEGLAHRHPGPGFGYVLEGEYEWAIDDQPSRVLKAGETFYEPTGCLHRVSKNPGKTGTTRVLAVVLQPRDADQIAIPEPLKAEESRTKTP